MKDRTGIRKKENIGLGVLSRRHLSIRRRHVTITWRECTRLQHGLTSSSPAAFVVWGRLTGSRARDAFITSRCTALARRFLSWRFVFVTFFISHFAGLYPIFPAFVANLVSSDCAAVDEMAGNCLAWLQPWYDYLRFIQLPRNRARFAFRYFHNVLGIREILQTRRGMLGGCVLAVEIWNVGGNFHSWTFHLKTLMKF